MQNDTFFLRDYQPPLFTVESLRLHFTLDAVATKVVASSSWKKQSGVEDLVLHGEKLDLCSISLNGKALSAIEYAQSQTQLRIFCVPAQFDLEIITQINPKENTELSGLYISQNIFCTQCEAEGFRRISYFLDRPDVLSVYDVVISADKAQYPVLLSNGNLIGQGDNDDGTHWCHWQDPHPKPSYLFALVGGDLQHIDDHFTTASGTKVQLGIYTQAAYIDQCDYAMQSLKRAMAWDEKQYQREYDLSRFNIVAVDDFTMGAMENKGLNIFNTKYILAEEQTATDADYAGVEAVVAHEYLHNWSGNRVTCRDWFQLSLKEGFTVFREQQFCADRGSAMVERIKSAQLIQSAQFKEDASPMAHPIRPESYQEINNFYTVTIYEKGAEVIRMLFSILGEPAFYQGAQRYFMQYDGKAATTDDFIGAMQAESEQDLTQFTRWYSQSGTPQLRVTTEYDATTAALRLRCEQWTNATADQQEKHPLCIPLAIALIGENGEISHQKTLLIEKKHQEFVFEDIREKTTVSVLRNFSAPIQLHFTQSASQLKQIVQYESDGFAQYQALQQCATNLLLQKIQPSTAAQISYDEFCSVFSCVLARPISDKALLAQLLVLPSITYIAQCCDSINPAKILAAHNDLRTRLASDLANDFLRIYQQESAESVASRALRNATLPYLACSKQHDLIAQQYKSAKNMTDAYAALATLLTFDYEHADTLCEHSFTQWRYHPLLLNKWFAAQAVIPKKSTLARVQKLYQHPQFSVKNPNNVYALLMSFAQNYTAFHQEEGDAYRFYANAICEIDVINPQVAARLVSALSSWQKFSQPYAQGMKKGLVFIQAQKGLSKDVREIVEKSLRLPH